GGRRRGRVGREVVHLRAGAPGDWGDFGSVGDPFAVRRVKPVKVRGGGKRMAMARFVRWGLLCLAAALIVLATLGGAAHAATPRGGFAALHDTETGDL